MNFKEKALKYHSDLPCGKISVVPVKPCSNQEELSLAYTPGVACASQEIADNPLESFKYTGRANLVGVVTDGSAVLGLGDIGPEASKPVMEGKSVLFKRFAGINSFDIELKVSDTDMFIKHVKAMEPTFGGINLEDIASPRCFQIEDVLKKELSIPVFHDDQHGTAVIAGAALLNAAELTGKSFSGMKIVICGTGAAGVAVYEHIVRMGVEPSNISCFDIHGVLYRGRKEKIGPRHEKMFRDTEKRTLKDLMENADVFIGVSAGGVVSGEMISVMASKPVIFALANPEPEISPEIAKKLRPDAIVGTGRSDFPNQVNNVMGFPAIFRGALDVRSTSVTSGMKIAASRALAELARKAVPESVLLSYGLEQLEFSENYLIPKPFDRRVLVEVASAVAQKAVDEGVARVFPDMEKYREKLVKLSEFLEENYG